MLYPNDYSMQSPLFNLIYLFDDEHPLPKHTRAIPDVLGTKKINSLENLKNQSDLPCRRKPL